MDDISTEEDTLILNGQSVALFVNLIEKNSGKLNKEIDETELKIIANSFDLFSNEIKISLIKQLSRSQAAEILKYLEPHNVELIIKSIPTKKIKEIIEEINNVDIINLIEDINKKSADEIIQLTPSKTRRALKKQIAYGNSVAGYEMNTNIITIQENQTIIQALKILRKNKELLGDYPVIFITNQKGELEGYVTLKRLLIEDQKSLISNIIHKKIIYVDIMDDIEDVSVKMSDYDLICIPVVDKEKKVQGIISNSEILDVIIDEATEDIHKMSAVNEMSRSYIRSSTIMIVKSRIAWLLLLVLFASSSEILLDNFETSIVISLTVMIPLIMDTAGNAAGQSSSTIVRGLATNEIRTNDYPKVLRKEFLVSIACAMVLVLINLGRMLIFDSERGLHNSLIASVGLGITVIFASIIGSMLPLIAKKIKIDPATMAGPIVTTLLDIVGLFIVLIFYMAFSI